MNAESGREQPESSKHGRRRCIFGKQRVCSPARPLHHHARTARYLKPPQNRAARMAAATNRKLEGDGGDEVKCGTPEEASMEDAPIAEGAVKEEVKCPPGMAQAPDQSTCREASSPRGQVSLHQHRNEAETWPADVRGRDACEVHERRRGDGCVMQVILRCSCSLVRVSGTQ